MNTVSPIYLYTGPEFGGRDDAVAAIKSSHKKKYGEIDEHLFYLHETPFCQVMTILQSGTLFSNGVLIVCKNSEYLKKKEDTDLIKDWLDNADGSAVLILISDEVNADAKLEKLIPPSNRKKFWEMFDDKKVPWVIDYCRKNNYIIREPAAELILDMVENNTQALRNECARLFSCIPNGQEITEENVNAILSHSKEETVFTLFNQISDYRESAEKRLEKGLLILQSIRCSKDSSSVMIIAGLSSCFRKLVLWHNQGESAISGKIMQQQYRSAAKIWTVGQATAILAILASTDMEIRSGGALMEDVLLQKLLYEVIIKKGSQIATITQ